MPLHKDLTNTSAKHGLHLPGYSVANAAARAALTGMAAGDLCYQQDTAAVYVYSGVSWGIVSGSGGGDWTDYSNTATIQGWSSYISKYIYYREIVTNLFFMMFKISGASNAAITRFSLPVTPVSVLGIGIKIWAYDAGAFKPNAYGNIDSVNIIFDMLGDYQTTFANGGGGTKTVHGEFIFQKA